MINPDDLALAREWAERVQYGNDGFDLSPAPTSLLTRVILNLPTEIVDGTKVRELSALVRKDVKMGEQYDLGNAFDKGHTSASRWIAGALDNLLPSPPRKPAMIKRGALAVHPEHGEVLVISNHPEDSGRVWVALDSEDSIDGSWTLRVQADELTAPDEDEPETVIRVIPPEYFRAALNNLDKLNTKTDTDEPQPAPVDGYAPGGIIPTGGEGLRFTTDQTEWLRSKGIRPEDYAADEDADQADVVRADGAPVEPTRSFPTGAHYDSEGNATEPEDVPAGEAWLIEFEGQRHHAVRCWVGSNIVYMFWTGNGRWTQINANYEDVTPVAPLVPKPEPRVLGTFKDYQDAAIGTIVRVDDPDTYFDALKKTSANLWQSTAGYKQDNNEMSETSRTTIWAPEEADQ